FHVDPEPGAFRAQDDPGVFAEALRRENMTPTSAVAISRERGVEASRVVAGAGSAAAGASGVAGGGLQALVDRYRREPAGRMLAGALPVHVTFPVFGPSIFLASELTEEGRAPSVELTFKRARS